MNMSFPYSSELPYPPIEVKEKNPLYAAQILSNIGGENSEMSAVASYFYCNLVTHDYQNISNAFHYISIIEMKHLEIFGKISLQLGSDPRLWKKTNRGMIYWSPNYIKYPKTLHALLTNSLQGEIAAINKYKKQCETIKNDNIVKNLERIIEDEKIHVEIFKELISNIK